MATERLVYVATVGTNIVVDPAPLDAETLNQRTAELTDPISYGLYSQKTQGKQFPEVLYLLCTSVPPPGSEGIAESLKQKWQALIPSIILRTIPAFDLDGAATAVSEIAKKERGAQITVNYSSGTNPMQAGTLTRAVDHVLLGDVAQIVYVQEFRERRKEGKGTFDTMELKQVEPLRLYYTRLFETALSLFRQFSYERAQTYFDQAEQIAPAENDRQRAQGYRRLCEAYLLWDAFTYRRVPEELREARKAFQGIETTLAENLSAKLDYLEKYVLNYNEVFPSLFHIVDMLENSVRELSRGRKHECLLKLYRFYEMLLHWRLAKTYNFFAKERSEELARAWPEITKIWAQKKHLKSPEDAEEELERIRRGKEDFYGREMERILDPLKDRILAKLQGGLDELKLNTQKLRAIRNDSPFYHGLETNKRAVTNSQLHGLIQLSYSLLQSLADSSNTLSQQGRRKQGLESLQALRITADVSAEELETLQRLIRPFSYDPLTLLKA